MRRSRELAYEQYSDIEEMSSEERSLIEAARRAAESSYAPFSKFRVGAAARLRSGLVICAANVESDVYPAGICAERNLLFQIASGYPNDPIVTLAVTSISSDTECYPCGICRQSLYDAERRQGSVIRVVMAGTKSAIVVESAKVLLPFTFEL